MTTATLKEQLHNAVETAGEEKLKMLYAILQDEITGKGETYTKEFKNELNERLEAYLGGKEKAFSADESKDRILKIFESVR